MVINWTILRVGLTLAVLLTLAGASHAQGVNQLVLTFDNPIQTGTIGDTLDFSGTASYPVSNLGGSFPLPLNIDDLEIDGTGLNLNDFFATNVPLSLNPDQSVPVDFFSVTITPDALPGTYIGTYNIETSNPFILPVNFAVNVSAPAIPAVPEPSPLPLLMVGLCALAVTVRRRVRH